MIDLEPVEPVETTAEVVCIRREGAYIRLSDWCPRTLVLMQRDEYPSMSGGRRGQRTLPAPTVGMTYAVRAHLPETPPVFSSFSFRFLGEVDQWRSKPLPPPAGVPGPGEELPLESTPQLCRLIQSVTCERLSNESLQALAYLVRRAHGLGSLGR